MGRWGGGRVLTALQVQLAACLLAAAVTALPELQKLPWSRSIPQRTDHRRQRRRPETSRALSQSRADVPRIPPSDGCLKFSYLPWKQTDGYLFGLGGLENMSAWKMAASSCYCKVSSFKTLSSLIVDINHSRRRVATLTESDLHLLPHLHTSAQHRGGY